MASDSCREDCVDRAKIAEQAERYDEMVKHITKVALMDVELTIEERNLLSVAYKNVIGAKRSSWRIVSGIEAKADSEMMKRETKGYRLKIEEELDDQCKGIISVLDKHLIPSTEIKESIVFLKKMKGDYYRYIAEYASGDAQKHAVEQSLLAYQAAQEDSTKHLTSTSPIRLGLALNFSVFFYEILGARDRACELARKAFDEASAELEELSEEGYKDSILIMQLLRDNLTLWTEDKEKEERGEEEDPVDN